MSEEDKSAKTFEPTEKKLKSQRDEGNLPNFSEMQSAISLTVISVLLYVFFLSEDNLGALGLSDDWRHIVLDGRLDAAVFSSLFLWVFLSFFFIFALCILFYLALGVTFKSIGFSGKAVFPKRNRISPVSNLKAKLGPKGIVDFIKSGLKTGLVMAVCAYFFWYYIVEASVLPEINTRTGIFSSLIVVFDFVWIVLAMFLITGLVDMVIKSRLYHIDAMMTLEEVKEESKESEGDPTFKAQRHKRSQSILSGSGFENVPDAEVVVVNPTHYAVALGWDRSKEDVPTVIARGCDSVALRIRQRAEQEGIPVKYNHEIARRLYFGYKVGDRILFEHFKIVASLIRFSDALREKRKGRARGVTP